DLAHQDPATLVRTGNMAEDIWQKRMYDLRHEVISLTRHVGRRALRSLHVEVLTTKWLLASDPERKDAPGQRLARLKQSLARRLDSTGVEIIQQFCRAADLRSTPDLV